MQITVAMRTRPLIVVAIETKPQMLTRSNAGNERNFASALLSTKRNFEMLNETSKHSTKFRNTQRNFARKFVTPNEISFEISRDVSRNYAKFRTCQDNSASKFLQLVFAYIRRNSLLLFFHSTVRPVSNVALSSCSTQLIN